MKKTKLLTSLVALALVVGLGACETGDIIVNVGDVDIGGDSSDTTDTEPSEPSEPSSSDTGSTPSEPEEDSSSSSSTPEEPPVVTHEYSIEVENADALKELTYDGNAATQQGVQLSIYLVDTPSEGTPTKEAATTEDVTFTVVDPTVVTVSGLTVLPLKEGSTSITIAWADKVTTSVDVLVTDVTVNEPEGPTSWADIITGNNGTEDYYDLLTALLGATIDDVLPFYYETEGNPSWYVTDTMFKLEYDPAPSGLSDVWFALLAADGWEQTDHTNNGWEDATTYAKNGYTVKITLDGLNCWDLYLYPPEEAEEEGGEDLETAQAILNAAAAQTNGFQDFEYVNVQARYSNGGGGAYQHSVFDLTTDSNNNVFGREMYHDEAGNDERANFRYYYEKNYYRINNSSGANTHYDGASYTNNSVNDLLSNRLGGTHDYDVAFDNASSIVLVDATDFELTTEPNGNYKLTFIYNNTWYCYKADTNLNLVGAGHAINWSDNYSYEIYYGEEESEDTFNALMEPFFEDEYWFPKESSEEEIASDILKAVQENTPNWTAFYADVTKDDDDAYKEYLTTDGDGNLYGYRYDWDDWEEEGSEFWYYGGYKCMYSYDGSQAQTPGEVYTTFEDELESLTYSLTISFDLASDPYTLTEVNGGYELTVAKSATYYNTYTFTVDASYNLLAIDTDAQVGSQSDEIALGHVEGISYEDVEAFIATTNFNPADFGFGGDTGGSGDEPEEPGESYGSAEVLAVLETFTERGSDYTWGDGFSYTTMSIDSYSYVNNEIVATNDNYGYMASTTYDFSISSNYAYEIYENGVTTFYYDEDGVEDYGSLYYGYYTFLIQAYFSFALQDYYYILEALEEFAYLNDVVVDDDFAISDTGIYIYAYTSDFSSYMELDASYDDNGLTSLSFSSYINGEALAVGLEPVDTVPVPEWYVPDTGAGEENPLAALAGTYTGTTAGTNSMRLLLNEDGTGIYDYEGTSPRNITWTLDGNTVKFELDGDDVVLTWDAEAGTLIGTYYQDYGEYEIAVNLSKDEVDSGDTQEEVINLVGTWTGQGTYSNTYTVTIYADGTYKLVLPSAEYTGTWTGSLDDTIELDVSSTVLEYFKLTYNATNDTAIINFEDDDYNDYTNVVYTRVG